MTLGAGIAIAGMWVAVAMAIVGLEWIDHGSKEGLSPMGIIVVVIIAAVTTYYVAVNK